LILAAASASLATFAVFSSVGSPEFSVSYKRQVIDTFFGNENNAATVSAIATIRAALRHVSLAAKAAAAITAFTGFDVNLDAVNKHIDW
jgi:hypothetical protein